jgi:MFS family permease
LGALALTVGLLASIGAIRVWIIWIAAGTLGLVKCFDLPALQSFLKDLVGSERLPNAVAWMSASNSFGRMIGSVAGGFVLATFGAAPGFLINAATFALVVLVLANLRKGALSPRSHVEREPGQIREGLIYVLKDPILVSTSVIMIVVFPTSYNFQISLALISCDVMSGNSETYGTLMFTLGVGMISGSLVLARHTTVGLPIILACTGALAATQTAVAVSDTLASLLATVFAYGVSAGLFTVTVLGTLQSRADENMRGRVLALYSICFNGSALVGGPMFGGLGQWIGVSGALGVSAVCCFVVMTTILTRQLVRRNRRTA